MLSKLQPNYPQPRQPGFNQQLHFYQTKLLSTISPLTCSCSSCKLLVHAHTPIPHHWQAMEKNILTTETWLAFKCHVYKMV